MFTRLGSGRYFGGMLSQVFLPIITTLDCPSGAVEVTLAKYFISLGRRHGRREFWPIPLAFVAATMMVRRDMRLIIGINPRITQSCNRKSKRRKTDEFDSYDISTNHKQKNTFHKRSVPFLPFRACRRFDFDLSLFDLIPVRAQCRTATLLVTFHHGTLRIFIRITKYLLEKTIECAITPDIWIFISGLLLLRT